MKTLYKSVKVIFICLILLTLTEASSKIKCKDYLAPSSHFQPNKYSDRFLGIFEELDEDSNRKSQTPSWQSHLDQNKQMIMEAAQKVPNKGRVLVLGTGNGTEMPIAYLAKTFDEVVLIGLSKKALTRAKEKADPKDRYKIKIIIQDVTNDVASNTIDYAESFISKTRPREDAIRDVYSYLSSQSFSPLIVDEKGFDFVISSMIIHQLQSLIYTEVESAVNNLYGFKTRGPARNIYYQTYSDKIWNQHLRTIFYNLRPDGWAFISGNLNHVKSTLGESETDYRALPIVVKKIMPGLGKLIASVFPIKEEKRWHWHTEPPTSQVKGLCFEVKGFIVRHPSFLITVNNSI